MEGLTNKSLSKLFSVANVDLLAKIIGMTLVELGYDSIPMGLVASVAAALLTC
jgi:hypothetical protein